MDLGPWLGWVGLGWLFMRSLNEMSTEWVECCGAVGVNIYTYSCR